MDEIEIDAGRRLLWGCWFFAFAALICLILAAIWLISRI